MDALEFLKNIRKERHELRSLKGSIEEYRLLLMPSGIRYDKDKVQAPASDRTAQAVAEMMEIEAQHDELASRIRTDIILAEKLVAQVQSPECRELLRLRYLSGGYRLLTWSAVAGRMGYSEDYVKGKLHGKAVGEAREAWQDISGPHKN